MANASKKRIKLGKRVQNAFSEMNNRSGIENNKRGDSRALNR